MKYLNKADIISSIAKKSGLTRAESRNSLKAMVDTITNALKENKGVRLMGFGAFKVNYRKARKGFNPQTRKNMTISARYVPTFKSGTNLKKAVNN